MGAHRSMAVWSIVVLLLSAQTAAAQSGSALLAAARNHDKNNATVRARLDKPVDRDTASPLGRAGASVNVPRARLLHIDVNTRAMPVIRRSKGPRRASRARWCACPSKSLRIDLAATHRPTTAGIADTTRAASATINRGPPAPDSLQKLEG